MRDVKKQYQRNHKLFEADVNKMPVFGTIASQFNDPGTNSLYKLLIKTVVEKTGASLDSSFKISKEMSEKIYVIPPKRNRYLAEIADANRAYNTWSNQQKIVAKELYAINTSIQSIEQSKSKNKEQLKKQLKIIYDKRIMDLDPKNMLLIDSWNDLKNSYKKSNFIYSVRDKEISVQTYSESLSGLKIPKISLPKYSCWGDLLHWQLQENLPGKFPFTSGIFPFKREGEDPTRMFAGEGGPERTNKRFHYVSLDMPAKRLSTAFDSVTLYGNDPVYRPDIYVKIGNAGVSICCLDVLKNFIQVLICVPH